MKRTHKDNYMHLRKEIKRLMNGVKKHRCRSKTGNWCLDCEIAHAKAQGINYAMEVMDNYEKERCG